MKKYLSNNNFIVRNRCILFHFTFTVYDNVEIHAKESDHIMMKHKQKKLKPREWNTRKKDGELGRKGKIELGGVVQGGPDPTSTHQVDRLLWEIDR